jgi:ubiquinone/menaquinone biosynthesis C-methylase UbiE
VAKYDSIGKFYDYTRKADSRITEMIYKNLDLNSKDSTIVDIGAGTGNYSVEFAKRGLKVIGIEPSEVMIKQGKKHSNLKWIQGKAEKLPIADNSVDGVISMLAIHHFGDLKKSLNEMMRVVKDGGSIVILFADPRLCPDDFWLSDYFARIFNKAEEAYLSIEELEKEFKEGLKENIEIKEFLIPYDIEDYFFVAGWRRPELYLDEMFRAGVSEEILNPILERLEKDLKSGLWEKRYGKILDLDKYDGGYRVLIAKNLRAIM